MANRCYSVHDATGEIIEVNAALNELVWAETGTTYFTGAFPVIDERFLTGTRQFQIRFGSINGRRMAFFTETDAGTVCNLRVSAGSLLIFATSLQAPNT